MSENEIAVTEKNKLGDIIKSFSAEMESLHNLLPVLMILLQTIGDKFNSDLETFIDEKCEIISKSDNSKEFKVNLENYDEWKKKSYHDKNFSITRNLLPKSFIITIVSQYDSYIGNILRYVFKKRPALISNSEKQFTFSEISEYNSIEEFADRVIEKEVESALRESHEDQISYIEKKLSLKLNKIGDELQKNFIELTERRNLFTHADGVVSKHYISVCQKLGLDVKEITVGTRLGVPQDYFNTAYTCMLEIGIRLGHTIWRQQFPESLSESEINYIDITYDLIERKEYKLAIKLLESALEHWKKWSDESSKLICSINCAQAYKWSGNQEHCLKILNEIDWSAKSDKFKLANFVLRNEWENCVECMKRMGKNGEIEKEYYKLWVLFHEFRTQQIFKDAYKSIFEEDFSTKEGDEKLLPKSKDG